MKPFNPKATCAKCGYADVATEFQPAGSLRLKPNTQYLEEVRVAVLERTCRRCGYAWDEAALKEP